MARVTWVLFWIGLSVPSWAEPSFSEHTDGMDASIAYLSKIFGVMEGVLQGGGSQIAGHLSSLLSTILFLGAGILWTYTLFVGVLNTASEGQFLGQKWSSMWVPVRTVIGVCLLMPKGITGYSLVQVIVMSIVIQGVHTANFAWRTTLNYIEKGGAIVEKVRGPIQGTNEVREPRGLDRAFKNSLIRKAGEVLKSEVCMMAVYYALEEKNREQKGMPLVGFSKLHFQNIYSGNNNFRKVLFPSAEKAGLCGNLTWDPNPGFERDVPHQRVLSGLSDTAMQEMVMGLLHTARPIARKIISGEPLQANGFTQGAEGALVNTAEMVMGLLKLQSRQKEAVRRALEEVGFTEKKAGMRKAGWLFAGNYYALLAKTNRAIGDIVPDWSWYNSETIRIEGLDQEKENKVMGYLAKQEQRDRLKDFLDNHLVNFIRDEQILNKALWIEHQNEAIDAQGALHDLVSDPFQESNQVLQKSIQSVLDVEKDPIIAFSKVGAMLLRAVERFWTQFNPERIRFPGLTEENSNIQRDERVDLKKLLTLPIIYAWMIINFALGSVLLYYIPLIPFLLFFFRALTWFTQVIIAVLAGNLGALALMHPEGDGPFAQAAQAMKLLVALFLNPMLMIFGLIFGMILCTVIFELFHYGYNMVIDMVIGEIKFTGILSGVSQVATTALYTTAAVSIVTRCFSLIYELPNRVFSWIGWQIEGHSEAEILSQARSSVDQHVGGIGQQVTGGLRGPVAPASDTTTQSIATIQGGNR